MYRYDLTKNFPNGDRYVGEAIEAGVKDGKGKYTWAASGASYSGEWKKDVMSGWGTYTLPENTNAGSNDINKNSKAASTTTMQDGYTYEGYFANGKRHTIVAITTAATASSAAAARSRQLQQQQKQQRKDSKCAFANGRTYVGDWMEDSMHGHGTLFGSTRFDNFVEYVGAFNNNRREGKNGRCQYNDGRLYEGEWTSDQMHGKGKMQIPNSQQTRSASSSSERPTAFDVYEGTFLQNAMTGAGTMKYALNNEMYEGDFFDGMKHGTGFQQLSFSSSSASPPAIVNGFSGIQQLSYQGTFQMGLRHGRGNIETEAFAYSGDFVFDQLEGHGVLSVKPEYATMTAATTTKGSPSDNNKKTSPFGSVLKYEGTFLSDTFNGMGSATFLDGSVYKGDFENNLQHGNGEHAGFRNEDYGNVRMVPGDAVGVYSGMFAFGKKHGFGRAKLEYLRDTYFFDGQWAGDVPQGEGKWEIVELRRGTTKYAGSVGAAGLPDGGFGQMQYPDGGGYKGEWSNGERSGKGRHTFPNEDHYDGFWQRDLYHGQGTFNEHHTSNSYTGTWVQGRKHGQGVYVEYGRSHYNGGFSGDMRHGRGVLKFNNGDVYEGEFREDLYGPKGKLTCFDGLSHEGEFQKGKLHGIVTTKFVNGNTYSGEYADGEIEGRGEMLLTNKDKYVGEFARGGIKCGRGTFHFAEGTQLECGWKDNALHGEGIFAARDGTKALRVYNEGSLVKETKIEAQLNPILFPSAAKEASKQKDEEEQEQVGKEPAPPQHQHTAPAAPRLQQKKEDVLEVAEQALESTTSLVSVSDNSTPASPAQPPCPILENIQQLQQQQEHEQEQGGRGRQKETMAFVSPPKVVALSLLPLSSSQHRRKATTATQQHSPFATNSSTKFRNPNNNNDGAVATASTISHNQSRSHRYVAPAPLHKACFNEQHQQQHDPTTSPQLSNEELAERAAQAVEQLSCQISEIEAQIQEQERDGGKGALSLKRKLALLRASRLREEQRFGKFTGSHT